MSEIFSDWEVVIRFNLEATDASDALRRCFDRNPGLREIATAGGAEVVSVNTDTGDETEWDGE